MPTTPWCTTALHRISMMNTAHGYGIRHVRYESWAAYDTTQWEKQKQQGKYNLCRYNIATLCFHIIIYVQSFLISWRVNVCFCFSSSLCRAFISRILLLFHFMLVLCAIYSSIVQNVLYSLDLHQFCVKNLHFSKTFSQKLLRRNLFCITFASAFKKQRNNRKRWRKEFFEKIT